MTPPPQTTIEPCPNPECARNVSIFTENRAIDGALHPVFQAQCAFRNYETCGYKGPLASTPEEAIRLHNLLCRQPTPEAADTSRVAKVLQESIARVRPIVLSEREGESVTGEVMNMILKGSECPCCYGKGKIPEDAPNATVAYLVGLSRSAAHPPKPEPTEAVAKPWCPDVCPITGRPFFMWIENEDGEEVPTYGGPYDSYTIPERDDDGTWCCARYDHDEGAWVEGVEDTGLIVMTDCIPGLVNGVRSLVKYHSKHGTMHLDCASDFNDLVGSYPDYSPSGLVVNEASAHPPKPPAEWMREELEKLANRIGTAATVNGYDKDTAAVLRAFRDDVRSLAQHYSAPAGDKT